MERYFFILLLILTMIFNSYAQQDYKGFKIDIDKSSNKETIKSTLPKRIKPAVVVHAIPSPTSMPVDIAFDGINLWVEGWNDVHLYKVSPVDGSIIKTIPIDITLPLGLEFENGHLWISNNDLHLIQKIDTSNGIVITSIPAPGHIPSSYPAGLAWDGSNLWQNDPMGQGFNPNDSTFQIDTTGLIIQSHHGYGTYVTGLAWDGEFLWSSDVGSQKIYKIEVSSFTVIDSIAAPGGNYANGLAFDGQYLWVSNNDSDSLYQVDISNTSTWIIDNTKPNEANYSIYPNPSKDEIIINLLSYEPGIRYSFKNLVGVELFKGELNGLKTIINLRQLQTGIYFLNILGTNRQSVKIIKN